MGWDDVEKILHHAFYNELRVAPEETLLVMPLPPQSSAEVRKKYCQIMFETFNVPAAYFGHAAMLSVLYSGVRSVTGLSVMSGRRCTYITPVYCGHALDYLTQKLPIGGQQVTDALTKMLTQSGLSFTTTAELQIVGHIKESCCSVALDYDNAQVAEKDYELPDGQVIKVGQEQVSAPEIVFQPQLHDEALDPAEALHHKIVSVVESCLPFMRTALYSNIVLSGGNTLFAGFPERLEKELKALLPDQYQQCVKVKAQPERRHQEWLGASLLGSMSWFPHVAISKEEYDECGPVIVERKCF